MRVRKRSTRYESGTCETPGRVDRLCHHLVMASGGAGDHASLSYPGDNPRPSFASLAAAQAHRHSFVVLEGEDGGSSYLAAPARVVQCTENDLNQLLSDLDFIAWPGSDEGSRRVVYEQVSEGDSVEDSFGGGVTEQGIWIHNDFQARGIASEIRDVVLGRASRISQQALYRGKSKRRKPTGS